MRYGVDPVHIDMYACGMKMRILTIESHHLEDSVIHMKQNISRNKVRKNRKHHRWYQH